MKPNEPPGAAKAPTDWAAWLGAGAQTVGAISLLIQTLVRIWH